jgi:UDP-N-acetylglucosamine 2-epimerase (non-hydrolysing)
VHGAGASSITSFPVSVPTGSVDAGLRMYELGYTAAQGVAGVMAQRFFVTSETSLDNLLRLGVPAGEIYLTGDLAIDAVRMAIERVRDDKCLSADLAASFPFIDPAKRLILVIGHRRDNCGGGLEGVCRALRRLATRPDVHVAYPAPSSPMARSVVEESFVNHLGVTLMEPQDYLRWIYLMQAAYLILADSGGTPREALAMGKPVLVMRDVAERPEVIDAGAIRLVGTDAERILRECTLFLDDPSYYQAFTPRRNPYGDGLASQRIVEMLRR